MNYEQCKIIPDSMELELAYWESFRSEWPMERYRSGEDVGAIARAHGRTTESLTRFFAKRYGKRWRAQKPTQPKLKPERRRYKRFHVYDKQIVPLLAEGWSTHQIAKLFGVGASTIQKQVNRNNLREVAANDTYKPAYAVA